MWLVATLAATAAFLARRLGLRDTGGSATPRASRAVAAVLLVAALAVALAQTVVIGVLTSFAHALDVDAVGAAWLLTAFMLASAVATPIAGRLGDQYGYHRVVVMALLLLLVGSGIAAVSTDQGWYAGALSGRALRDSRAESFPAPLGWHGSSCLPVGSPARSQRSALCSVSAERRA